MLLVKNKLTLYSFEIGKGWVLMLTLIFFSSDASISPQVTLTKREVTCRVHDAIPLSCQVIISFCRPLSDSTFLKEIKACVFQINATWGGGQFRI